MKKALTIFVPIAALLAAAVIGIGIYIRNTPQYALKDALEDVQAAGVEGLSPHLTNKAQKTFDTISATAEGELFDSVIETVKQNNYVQILKSKMQEVQWSIQDVLKGKKDARVIISFDYKDKIKGTVELSMVKEGGEWKIDGMGFPKFDNSI